MRVCSSSYSSCSRLRSSAASRFRGISKIAWAWTSLNLKLFIRLLRAVSTRWLRRMVSITSSRMSRARSSPSTMCALAWARARSYSERRRTISRRCSTNSWSIRFRPRVRGSSLTSASIDIPKVCCIGVYLKRLANTSFGSTLRVSSMTMRIPVRSLSSRRSVMPSSLLSRTRVAIRSNRLVLLVW